MILCIHCVFCDVMTMTNVVRNEKKLVFINSFNVNYSHPQKDGDDDQMESE